MSHYTTGEMAKACGVTVRTVQYYDSRNILTPSALSEGGRRLYSKDDLRRLKIICFLRETGLSIDSIGQLLKEEKPGNVISLLLTQQENLLQEEIQQRQDKLQKLAELKSGLKEVKHFSIESIGDIAVIMENKARLRKTRLILLLVCLPVEILEILSIILWAAKGIWLPFLFCILLTLIVTIWGSQYYHKRIAYICPECHTVFKPRILEFVLSVHTPTARKLNCTSCGHHGFCVETWGKDLP